VGGGNTVNLLAVWRAQGIDAILRETWRAGVVPARLCAGSMCWFEGGVTASFGRRLAPLDDGLGFLPGSNCPHYRHRREAHADAVRGGLPSGLAADDGVALHLAPGAARLPGRRRGGAPRRGAPPADRHRRRRAAATGRGETAGRRGRSGGPGSGPLAGAAATSGGT
jgi:hypothetical protein